MKEVKLTIDGKEVWLTAEQLKALGIGVEEKRKNPFERVPDGEAYYYSTGNGLVCWLYENHGNIEDYNAANHFNDKAFAGQVALHQLLYRKLLKFAYDNECEDNQIWGGNGIEHWRIGYDIRECVFYADWVSAVKHNDVYFSTKDGAERAIKEVVEPFVKEHSEFVW